MKKLIIALTLMVAALTTAHAASTNLVHDGSFEETTQASGTWSNYSYLASGWWRGGDFGIELRNNVDGKASDGVNFVELDTTSNSSIAQYMLTNDTSYILTFDYQNRPGTVFSTNGLAWQFGKLSGTVPSVTDYVWHTFSTPVTTLPGVWTPLIFSATGTSDSYGTSLDNVSVTATPIPGAVWLFGSGLVGLMAAKRRKNQAV